MKDLLTLTKIKNGDVKAFEQVFRLYYMPLCMFAASITGRMDIAEEIVQELFYVFWKERERLQLFHTIKSYLYGAVRMHRFEGKKYAEIASSLSLSVKTVEAEMTKALRTLRDELEIYMKYD